MPAKYHSQSSPILSEPAWNSTTYYAIWSNVIYARNELKQRKPFKNTCKMARFYTHCGVNAFLKSRSFLYTCLSYIVVRWARSWSFWLTSLFLEWFLGWLLGQLNNQWGAELMHSNHPSKWSIPNLIFIVPFFT